MYVKVEKMDIYTGMREDQLAISGPTMSYEERRESVADYNASLPKGMKQTRAMRFARTLF